MNNLLNSRRNRTNLYSNTDAVRLLVRSLFKGYQEFRAISGIRAVNANDEEKYKRHIEIVILDLLAAWDGNPKKYIGYSRSKKYFIRGGAYWNHITKKPFISRTIFFAIIDYLADKKLIENKIAAAGYTNYSSRMRATKKLGELFEKNGLNWSVIQTDLESPLIIVKDKKKRMIPLPDPQEFDLVKASNNIKRINANLQSSLINLHISDEEYDTLKLRLAAQAVGIDELEDIREPLEFSNRSLRRIFSLGNYNNGGRFYGGWWQGLPSEYRKHIEIEGSVTAEMDYATLQPRILYARTGAEPPVDSYSIEGWNKSLRKIIKKAFNQLVNSVEKSRGQWQLFAPDLYPNPLPDDWNELKLHQQNKLKRDKFKEQHKRDYSELLQDLIKMHKPIDDKFFSSTWGEMQRTDSQIAEMVMIKLLDHVPPITALPIHDSFIVRRGGEEVLRNAMKNSFEEIVGVECMIDRDVTVYDCPDGNEKRGLIVASKRQFAAALDDMVSHLSYNRREAEWRKTHGLFGFD